MSSSSSHEQLVILPPCVAVGPIWLAIVYHLVLFPILIVVGMRPWRNGRRQSLTRTVRAATFAAVRRVGKAIGIVVVLTIVVVVAVGGHICEGDGGAHALCDLSCS